MYNKILYIGTIIYINIITPKIRPETVMFLLFYYNYNSYTIINIHIIKVSKMSVCIHNLNKLTYIWFVVSISDMILILSTPTPILCSM